MNGISEVLMQHLNNEQRSAALDPSAEVLALACAGSGKSRTLAYRIVRLLAEGEDASGLVAFTFTEKAAESIKRRVSEALLQAGISPTKLGAMYIGTIHSYCNYILGEIDARYKQFDVLDENRLKLYLISRYAELGINTIRGAGRYFDAINGVADAWKTMNDEMIDLQIISNGDAQIGAVLTNIWGSLNDNEFIDFSLMIRLVAEALRRNDQGAVSAVKGLTHLMVDEYQDVNPSQELLIQQLHRFSKTLFVVGDDDQSIYAWRGADVNNILSFPERYPNCSRHILSVNYRSTPAIVSASDRFASSFLGARRFEKHPRALQPSGTRDFRNLWFEDREAEAAWVVGRIERLLGTAYHESNGTVRGLTPGDFAILMRSTRSAEQDGHPRHTAFTQQLTLRGIPFVLEAGGSVFDRPQVQALRDTFELLRNESPSRQAALTHFQEVVLPAYPFARFELFASVLSTWGRLIHVTTAGTRRRVYPQALLHDLLEAFNLGQSTFDDGTMQDIGQFSRMLLDVETVYVSVDSPRRFQEVLNFLQNVAERGYDTSTNDVISRPDAITVSTVHKMKGLEFPVVFVVDVEAGRFPGKQGSYSGLLPTQAIRGALIRGAYQNSAEEEARLFYTAITRAERFLYITGCTNLPGARSQRRPSHYSQGLHHEELLTDPIGLPPGTSFKDPARRFDETVVPTSYSDLRYFLRCPHDYQLRKRFGFNPPIPELFGFGKTVHTSISRLHQLFPNDSPTGPEADSIARETFHLKHVPPSRNPANNPGPYERAQQAAAEIVRHYVEGYSEDFSQRRQLEVRFEIPVDHAVISGAIDLLLRMNESEEIMDATVVDFKTMDGGIIPEENDKLHWTELALQVQLYAQAARDVLNENARTGSVHFLKDNQRVEVPVDRNALDSAIHNVEWAVERIIDFDYPRRPDNNKCSACDFYQLCSRRPEEFSTSDRPPGIRIPGILGTQDARALSEFDPTA